jgi:hypothetical protein
VSGQSLVYFLLTRSPGAVYGYAGGEVGAGGDVGCGPEVGAGGDVGAGGGLVGWAGGGYAGGGGLVGGGLVGGTLVAGALVGGTLVGGTLVAGTLVGGTEVAGALVAGAVVRVGSGVEVGRAVWVAVGTGLEKRVAVGCAVGWPAAWVAVGARVGARLGSRAACVGVLLAINAMGVTVGTDVCRSETTVAMNCGAFVAAGLSLRALSIRSTPAPETGMAKAAAL